jgi:hypothetical protein
MIPQGDGAFEKSLYVWVASLALKVPVGDWPIYHLSAIQVAIFHVAFGIEDQTYIGTETKVRIQFGKEGGHGCLGTHGSQVFRTRLSRRDLI